MLFFLAVGSFAFGQCSSLEVLYAGKCSPSQIKGKKYTAIFVPNGRFKMGCTEEQGNFCDDDEKPAHLVEITHAFYMMRSEVTQGFYRSVIGKNPSLFSDCGDLCPVEKVSWDNAIDFANALSRREKLEECYQRVGPDTVLWKKGVACEGWRLPTEAEWEYAAKGGEQGQRNKFLLAGGNNPNDVGWYKNNSDNRPQVVCTKKRNQLGLCDMSGNVWEWVWDSYHPRAYQLALQNKTSYASDTGYLRVLRGGSWDFPSEGMRTTVRFSYAPFDRYDSDGFRLVRTVVTSKMAD